MMRYLTLSTALLIFFTTGVSAQRRQPVIPAIKVPAGISTAQLQKKLQQVTHAVYRSSGARMKTTAGNERLVAAAYYDVTVSPNVLDSVRFVYSGARTSGFDFQGLMYDFYNSSDMPSPFMTGGFVHYDTMRDHTPGSGASLILGVRSYNAAGKVTRDQNADYISLYEYNAQNRLAKVTVVEYNPSTSSWDSSYRDFFLYDASGYLLKDSAESWDPSTMTFEPSAVLEYLNNAQGRPIQVLINFSFGPVSFTIGEYDFLYNSSNLPIRTTLKFFNGTALENVFKDTIGYTGTMPVYNNSYSWDTTANDWSLTYMERRHLNSASLPDSVWGRTDTSGVPMDTTIRKLAYSTEGNPVYMRTYYGNSTTHEEEERWYYAPFSSGGVGIAGTITRKSIVAYPNPAADKLYLKDVQEGQYMIHNAVGQIIQSGTLQAAAVPIHTLTPGIYSLSVQDKAGSVFTTQFVKQ